MYNISLDFLNDIVTLNDDSVDELFTQILHVDPPEHIVEGIMKAVSALPLLKPLSKWDGFDFFVTGDLDQLS
jgi:hypothetical protein